LLAAEWCQSKSAVKNTAGELQKLNGLFPRPAAESGIPAKLALDV
jgi:hypothetical protein